MKRDTQYKLYDIEYRFASIIWENEPVGSGELVKLCEKLLDWKKSTTYTVLKKLCNRGILLNQNSVVTSLIKREQVLEYQSRQVVEQSFDGSLPQFVAAFMNSSKLTRQDICELKKLIDSCEGGGDGNDS